MNHFTAGNWNESWILNISHTMPLKTFKNLSLLENKTVYNEQLASPLLSFRSCSLQRRHCSDSPRSAFDKTKFVTCSPHPRVLIAISFQDQLPIQFASYFPHEMSVLVAVEGSCRCEESKTVLIWANDGADMDLFTILWQVIWWNGRCKSVFSDLQDAARVKPSVCFSLGVSFPDAFSLEFSGNFPWKWRTWMAAVADRWITCGFFILNISRTAFLKRRSL